MFVSILSVCASDYTQDINDIKFILDNTDKSDLTGCCSVVLQLDGNNSIFSFRRDAEQSADIYIEQLNWHGHNATKQYKTSGGYFCQAIVTQEGWVIGYGGIDDGIDNRRIENITAGMINDNYTISNESLAKIQQIKADYQLGHVLIKAPNGNYGFATYTNHKVGKLEPGDYVSMPNRYQYSRSGEIPLNSTDKIAKVVDLATSDMFGLTRRDITTFYYHQVDNDTFKGNVTDLYLSNDDGSRFGMSTGGLVDDVYFNNSVIKGSDIPIAPKYMNIGTIEYPEQSQFDFFTLVLYTIIFIIFVGILFFAVLQLVRYFKFRYLR